VTVPVPFSTQFDSASRTYSFPLSEPVSSILVLSNEKRREKKREKRKNFISFHSIMRQSQIFIQALLTCPFMLKQEAKRIHSLITAQIETDEQLLNFENWILFINSKTEILDISCRIIIDLYSGEDYVLLVNTKNEAPISLLATFFFYNL
jgi:hypothetical protein